MFSFLINLFSKRKAAKSKEELANQIQEVACIVQDSDLRRGFILARDRVLRQTFFPQNWKTLDDEMRLLLFQVSEHANKDNTSTIDVYLDYLNHLVDARARQEDYINDEFKKTVFDFKVKMHALIDIVRRLIVENTLIVNKIERTPNSDPTRFVLESEKKSCEAKYYDASQKIKHLATAITGFTTGVTNEDVMFYKKLRELQGSPEELQENTSRLLFDQQKFESTAEYIQIINDSRFENMAPMPTLADSYSALPQRERSHETPSKPVTIPTGAKKRTEAE